MTTDKDAGSSRNDEPKHNVSPQGRSPEVPPHGSVISFDELAEGKDVVLIELAGQYYRLSRTRLGRLVLTK